MGAAEVLADVQAQLRAWTSKRRLISTTAELVKHRNAHDV